MLYLSGQKRGMSKLKCICDLLWENGHNDFPFKRRNRLPSVYIRLNGLFKRLNGLLIRLKKIASV